LNVDGRGRKTALKVSESEREPSDENSGGQRAEGEDPWTRVIVD